MTQDTVHKQKFEKCLEYKWRWFPNFRMYTREAGIWRFLQEQKYWWIPFFFFSFPSLDNQMLIGASSNNLYLASNTKPVLVFCCGPICPTQPACLSRHPSKVAPAPPHPICSPSQDQHPYEVTSVLGSVGWQGREFHTPAHSQFLQLGLLAGYEGSKPCFSVCLQLSKQLIANSKTEDRPYLWASSLVAAAGLSTASRENPAPCVYSRQSRPCTQLGSGPALSTSMPKVFVVTTGGCM